MRVNGFGNDFAFYLGRMTSQPDQDDPGVGLLLAKDEIAEILVGRE